MDSLKKWREPAAWVVMVALAVNIVLVVPDLLAFPGPRSVVAAGLAYRVASPIMIIVLAALVATCVLIDPTPRARLLTLLSMITAGVAVLLALIFAVIGLGAGGLSSALDLVSLLATLAVPVVGLGLLIKLSTAQPALDRSPALPIGPPTPAIAASPPPPPNPQWEPTWQPDAAAGAVWRTAGEAASGAPASGWGTPGPDDPADTGEDQNVRRWSN